MPARRRPAKTLATCVSKAVDLEKAFAKFIQLKEAKAELKEPAKKQLEAWSKELKECSTGLAKLYKSSEKDLKAGDVKNLQLDQFVL